VCVGASKGCGGLGDSPGVPVTARWQCGLAAPSRQPAEGAGGCEHRTAGGTLGMVPRRTLAASARLFPHGTSSQPRSRVRAVEASASIPEALRGPYPARGLCPTSTAPDAALLLSCHQSISGQFISVISSITLDPALGDLCWFLHPGGWGGLMPPGWL